MAKQPGTRTANIRPGEARPLPPAPTALPPWPFCLLRLRDDLPKPAGYPQTPKTLGEHIKKMRMDRKLTQRQVAHSLGVRQTSVCEWETGKLSPSVACLPGIIRFLGYDPRPAPQTFGQRLVYLRETYGLSQRALAKVLGVDPLTLRRWEKDQCQPTKRLRK